MEMNFHSHANKTHFNKKGCALGLILKVKVFGTRKWPCHRKVLSVKGTWGRVKSRGRRDGRAPGRSLLFSVSLRSICPVRKVTFNGGQDLACEQALRGALVAGREREGELSFLFPPLRQSTSESLLAG